MSFISKVREALRDKTREEFSPPASELRGRCPKAPRGRAEEKIYAGPRQSLGVKKSGAPIPHGKLEYQNPTGSFKDRGNAVQVTVLKEAGITEIADSTAGNAGNSTAAYCARAGIRYIGFVEEGVRDRKAEAMALHGAELHWVKGDRQARMEAVRKMADSIRAIVFAEIDLGWAAGEWQTITP